MKRCDNVRSIITMERKSSDHYIADQYKGKNFLNSMSVLYNNLSGTTNKNDQAFRGRNQTNVHSVVLYDVENNNDLNGPSKYDYCRPGTDPDFNSY